MAIIGLPRIGKNSYGEFVCKCSKFFSIAATRALAFQEWQKLSKENPTVREKREHDESIQARHTDTLIC